MHAINKAEYLYSICFKYVAHVYIKITSELVINLSVKERENLTYQPFLGSTIPYLATVRIHDDCLLCQLETDSLNFHSLMMRNKL